MRQTLPAVPLGSCRQLPLRGLMGFLFPPTTCCKPRFRGRQRRFADSRVQGCVLLQSEHARCFPGLRTGVSIGFLNPQTANTARCHEMVRGLENEDPRLRLLEALKYPVYPNMRLYTSICPCLPVCAPIPLHALLRPYTPPYTPLPLDAPIYPSHVAHNRMSQTLSPEGS